MESIYLEKITEVRKNLRKLKKELNINITLQGRKAIISGDPLDEYTASIVLNAMSFGFSAAKSLQLKDPDMVFQIIHIKDHTRRKNLREVKARIIGKKGRTKRTMENISGSDIIIKDNHVGIICEAEELDTITTALTNLIRGTKQGNVYGYLEKQNRNKKSDGLGLKY